MLIVVWWIGLAAFLACAFQERRIKTYMKERHPHLSESVETGRSVRRLRTALKGIEDPWPHQQLRLLIFLWWIAVILCLFPFIAVPLGLFR